jgi:hypothetical protein
MHMTGVQLALLGRADLGLLRIITRHPYYLWRVDNGEICSLEDDRGGQKDSHIAGLRSQNAIGKAGSGS